MLETAGKRWAWRKAMIVDAISNAYCIEDDYKRLDTQTRKEIAPVNERAACSDEADPGRRGQRNSWKKHVEDAPYLFFTKGEQRRSTSLAGLMRLAADDSAHAPQKGIEALFSLLRSQRGSEVGLFLNRMKTSLLHRVYSQRARHGVHGVEYLPGGAIVRSTDARIPGLAV